MYPWLKRVGAARLPPGKAPILSRPYLSLVILSRHSHSYNLSSTFVMSQTTQSQAVLTKEFFDRTHGKYELVRLTEDSEVKAAQEIFTQVVQAGTTSDYYRRRDEVEALIKSPDSHLFVLRSSEDKEAGNLAFAVVTEEHDHVVVRVAYTLPNGKGRWAISHLIHLFHEKWRSLDGFKTEPVGFAVDLSAKFVKSTVETLASFYPQTIYCVDAANLTAPTVDAMELVD